MMRIAYHGQRLCLDVDYWLHVGTGREQRRQRTPNAVAGECKVTNERQLSKKLKSSNAEKERTKRMEDK
jgi:hypothetical protein